MKKSKFLILLLVFSIVCYNCSNDDLALTPVQDSIDTEEEEEEEEVIEDPAITLANSRTTSITILTKNAEKIWRISSAELVNTNGTFDITTNFNVNDDEFIFKNSPLTSGKNLTDFEGSLEWRKNNDIILSADSPQAAANELYVPTEKFSFDFEAESSSKLLSNDGKFEFVVDENGDVSGILDLVDAQLTISLQEKQDTDYPAIPTMPLNFTSAFSFDSNAIAGNAPDMVGSLANNSIYISMREDALAVQGAMRPERVLKYNLNSSTLSEKLFPQSDFVSKQLIVNNNKLLVVGGQKINTYDLDIVADPTQSQSYATALGLQSFFVSRNGTAVHNNSIYLVGGSLGDPALANRIYKFDIATEIMTEFAVMPETRSAARAEIVNDKLYIFGGSKEFYTPPAEDEIYIYDLTTGGLTIETMPTAVDFTFAGRSGNLIYVAGNIITRDTNNTITNEEPYLAVYDTDNGTYTELQTNLMSPALQSIHSMAVFNNKLYIIYGERDTNLTQGQLQTWTVLSADI